MRRIFILLSVPALVTLALVAPVRAQQNKPTVTVVHGLPEFTADVYLDGARFLDGFKPTQATDPIPVSAGPHDIEVREVGSAPDSPPALEGTVNVRPGSNISVVAHLTGAGEPTLSVFSNAFRRLPAGRARLVVRDVANAPPLTLRLDAKTVVRGLALGEEREVDLEASRHSIGVRSGGDALVPDTDLMFVEGVATIVYVIGSSADGTMDLMVQRVAGLHSAPTGVLTGDGGFGADAARGMGWLLLLIAGSSLVACGIYGIRRATSTT